VKKRALADVLWTAANVHLSAPRQRDVWNERDEFSCYAVSLACGSGYTWNIPAVQYLYELGCKFNCDEVWPPFSDSRLQGVRYMWLLLAMHVAADEGITV
jgi:hypothetical protein